MGLSSNPLLDYLNKKYTHTYLVLLMLDLQQLNRLIYSMSIDFLLPFNLISNYFGFNFRRVFDLSGQIVNLKFVNFSLCNCNMYL